MKRAEHYGNLNANAPPELSQFTFLIGRWRCEAKLKGEAGTWERLKATWEGRYILEGYAIGDEYRMTTPDGEPVVLGINLRAYDTKKKAWNMKWLNALAGTWFDLGPEELGGVKFQEGSITYSYKEPSGPHAFTRSTYLNISKDHFCEARDRTTGRRGKSFWSLKSIAAKNNHSARQKIAATCSDGSSGLPKR